MIRACDLSLREGSTLANPWFPREPPPQGVEDAPGMIRTCDLSLRRPALYPLSYGRAGR